MTAPPAEHRPGPVLRTGIAVTTAADGRLVATVELHGDLCAATAPQLRSEMAGLVQDGVADIVLELAGLRICTSHGLDVWDDVHRDLHERRGGAVRLHAPRGAVRKVLRSIADIDPTFAPVLELR